MIFKCEQCGHENEVRLCDVPLADMEDEPLGPEDEEFEKLVELGWRISNLSEPLAVEDAEVSPIGESEV